jgi:hypothetical protein
MCMGVSPHVLWTILRKPAWLEAMLKTPVHWDRDLAVRPGENILTRRDDGAHPCRSPFYFEWWYFDISLPDGAALTFSFHLTDLIKPASKTGSLSMSFFGPDQPTWKQFTRYPRYAITASSAECDVRIGGNRCWIGPDDVYHVLIDERQIKAEITFDSLVPGWRPGNGTFQFGNPQHFFSWAVPQPRAQVTGYIQLQGTRREIEGIGYHDHNWGTVSLLDTVSEWSWGRVYLEDYTCVFADVCLSPRYGDARAMPFTLFQGDQVLISSFLQRNEPLDPGRDFLHHPKTVQFPEGWHLYWENPDERLVLKLRTQHVLEKTGLLLGSPIRRWIIERLVAHPFYIRCYAAAQGEWKHGQQTDALQGHAIYEQTSLRK